MILPIIFVCLAGAPVCDENTSVRTTIAPMASTLMGCQRNAQATLAAQVGGIEPGEQVIIICRRAPE
jgi:hypothetical protein